MIITTAVALVSAVMLAKSEAKRRKEKVQLNDAMDSNMGLQEENRVLNTCLETMETEIKVQKSNTSTDLADDLARREKTISRLVSDRDFYKRLYDQAWDEKVAYKRMLEETKKAAQ
jgi:glycine cleavage system pyridoxal-binding protein P